MNIGNQDYPNIDFIPPAAVAKEAKKGLELRARFRRGGTFVGIDRARELMSGKPLHPRVILRMYSFFARHEIDKRGKHFNDLAKPSNGKIAWLLWGGDAGQRWAKKVREAMRSSLKSRTAR